MRASLLLFISMTILLGFSFKDKPKDVEMLFISGELIFSKSDSVDMIKALGSEYKRTSSSKHARMAGGGDWYWSYYYYDYGNDGIQIELTKFINSGKQYETEPKFRLSKVRLYSNYKYPVLKTVKIGETTFKELLNNYHEYEISKGSDNYDFENIIYVQIKSYTFNIKIDIPEDKGFSEIVSEKKRNKILLDLINDREIEYVEIVKEKK